MQTPTTIEEFHLIWNKFLEPGHYGLAINDAKVIEYLHNEFKKEIESNPNFVFSQIKIKWQRVTIYSNSESNQRWVADIEAILNAT